MAALAGIAVGPFGHEGSHHAAALGQYLHEGLEQRGLVGGFQRPVVVDRRLQHAGPGLGVQPLDRDAHGLEAAEDLVIKVGPDRAAQPRIAEIAGRDVREVAIALLAHALRRLVEQEELVFEGRAGGKAHPLRLLQHPAQGAARAERLGRACELAKEEERALLEGQRPAGLGQDAHRRIRIGGVPAREGHIVIELIVGVPAQHHVAEAEAAVEGREELGLGDVFAAQHAIGVEQADLDVGDAPLLDDLARLGRAADVFGLQRHEIPPPVRRHSALALAALSNRC